MNTRSFLRNGLLLALALVAVPLSAPVARASGGSGGSGGGGSRTDSVKVSKCMFAASNSTMLISASSSDAAATLKAYLPSGALLGNVQNGGGSRYGGTVFWVPRDPKTITIRSSSGGSIQVSTSPYRP